MLRKMSNSSKEDMINNNFIKPNISHQPAQNNQNISAQVNQIISAPNTNFVQRTPPQNNNNDALKFVPASISRPKIKIDLTQTPVDTKECSVKVKEQFKTSDKLSDDKVNKIVKVKDVKKEDIKLSYWNILNQVSKRSGFNVTRVEEECKR